MLALAAGCAVDPANDPEPVGSSAQELLCTTLFRGAAGNVSDTFIANDPLDPSVGSANFGAAMLSQTGTLGTATRQTLLGFDFSPIPVGSAVQTATLSLKKNNALGPSLVHVLGITAPWSESTVTWSSFGGAFDPSPIVTVDLAAVPAGGTVSIDLTSTVQAWLGGTLPSYGIVLDQPGGGRASFGASEAGPVAPRPKLQVCYVPPACANGHQDPGETGVDCGGSCPACPTCSDGILNQGETGVDCGGPCAACATCSDGILNQGETGVDCGGPCAACATCSDGIQNQSETGVDCGGPCAACATCSDGILNQGETGVDCGGPCAACATCSDGILNQGETGVDCGGPCAACATCSDGIQNQGETGVDCGGPCAACATCSDGIQNQGETGVDCGGPCAACATCSDGIQNQGETGVDCGGPCAACGPPTGNMTLWLKADALGLANGAAVTSWADQSPNGNTVSTAGAPGYYLSKVINGKPAVYFDGTVDLTRGGVVGTNLASASDNTLYLVIAHASYDAYTDLLGWGDCVNNRFLVHAPWGGTLVFQMGNPANASIPYAVPGTYSDTPHILEFHRSGNLGELWIDGSVVTTSTMSGGPSVGGTSTLHIGNSACNNTFTGYVAEIIVFSRALSAGERATARNYLTGKYVGCYGASCGQYTSCNALHAADSSLPTGTYTIDPDGPGPMPQRGVYCDMVGDGGGYTMVMRAQGAFPNAVGLWSTTAAINPMVVATGPTPVLSKLSDTEIAAIRGGGQYRLTSDGAYSVKRFASSACTYQHTTPPPAFGPCTSLYSDAALTQLAKVSSSVCSWHQGITDFTCGLSDGTFITNHTVSGVPWVIGNGSGSTVYGNAVGGNYTMWVR